MTFKSNLVLVPGIHCIPCERNTAIAAASIVRADKIFAFETVNIGFAARSGQGGELQGSWVSIPTHVASEVKRGSRTTTVAVLRRVNPVVAVEPGVAVTSEG